MWTLKLIISGLVFIGLNNGDYSLLVLNPDYLSGSTPTHQARLTLRREYLSSANTRLIDDFDAHSVAFILDNEDLTLTATSSTIVGEAPPTRNGEPKPCETCNPGQTVATMRPDPSWPNALLGIATKIPVIDTTIPTVLRTDIFAAPYSKDTLMFARLGATRGTISTYSLWGEDGQPDNNDATAIHTYCFVEPGANPPVCLANPAAVAETVAITIDVAAGTEVSIASRRLNATHPGAIPPIVIKGALGDKVIVELSSRRPGGHVHNGDFSVFYDLLTKPANLKYRAVPKAEDPLDAGGACSPVRP